MPYDSGLTRMPNEADSCRKFVVPKLPPISRHGNVAEIAKRFGGVEQLGTTVNPLQALLYAA